MLECKDVEEPACLRQPEELLQAKSLGAFHASYISFSRSLVRAMICEEWRIQKSVFKLDDCGFGKVVYRIETAGSVYHAVFFTQFLDPSFRNDRVIAEAWDMTCTLWRGEIEEQDIQDLYENVPLQEKGRYKAQVISISRANKSMRLFEYVVDCLANGAQPSAEKLKSIGYLARTTAVYGNGKFGMSDYLNLLHTDFQCQFRAQMFVVYMVRQFTIDWVQHIARCKNPQKALTLSPNVAQFIGIGNSTGLGMVPYLVKHPHVVHTWLIQRERALHEIIHKAPATEKTKRACMDYLEKGIVYFNEWIVPDVVQQEKNAQLVSDLQRLLLHMRHNASVLYNLWPSLWEHCNERQKAYGFELREVFLSILMEIYPAISEKYENFAYVSDPFPSTGSFYLNEVLRIVEKNFDWALKINYNNKDATHFFWYRSEEKAEPRLGERYTEEGSDKEMKIDVARRVHQLYYALKQFTKHNEHAFVAEFLLEYPQWSGEIRRVVSYAQYPYGEIRENILAKKLYAIDILRVKLAFFGAVKFNPKSDRWLRVTLFQGAPLLDNRGYVQSNDNWFLYRYEGVS